MGNLAQVHVILSCHKPGNGQEQKVLQGQRKVKEFNQRKFVFFRQVRESIFLIIQVFQ